MGSTEIMPSLAPSEKSADAGHGNKQNGPNHRKKSKGFFKDIKAKLLSLEEKIKQVTTKDGEGQHNDNAQFVSHEHRFKKIEDEHDKDHGDLERLHKGLESLQREVRDIQMELQSSRKSGY
jgi:chromosome segregation ATPase